MPEEGLGDGQGGGSLEKTKDAGMLTALPGGPRKPDMGRE
ncbi:hypothetical protein ACS15_3512 [Ralstonia insidiosa]|uniref:Uncharacterized protein n=1 Tax=Ralstonia insidiosa TaxID=190721 RepID=A0AAC9FPW4_9RALS|nr:hypothetical protein ACS15_3512 [Ralstonia insidiosa]